MMGSTSIHNSHVCHCGTINPHYPALSSATSSSLREISLEPEPEISHYEVVPSNFLGATECCKKGRAWGIANLHKLRDINKLTVTTHTYTNTLRVIEYSLSINDLALEILTQNSARLRRTNRALRNQEQVLIKQNNNGKMILISGVFIVMIGVICSNMLNCEARVMPEKCEQIDQVLKTSYAIASPLTILAALYLMSKR